LRYIMYALTRSCFPSIKLQSPGVTSYLFIYKLLILLCSVSKNFSNTGDINDIVTFFSVLKLGNVLDNEVRLHSHEVKYGSGSGQQSVTGINVGDDVNSHWQIYGANDVTNKHGQPVKCNSIIRLMHLTTHCFLHSHDFSAPLSQGSQEVSCFGKEGEGSDSGDHYKVICDDNFWQKDAQIRLKHVDTGNYVAISGKQYGRPISGQREIVAIPSNDYSSLWIAAEGIYIKPSNA